MLIDRDDPKPIDRERERQLIALRLKSPKRSSAAQEDANHLPLFVVANEPELFA